MGVMHVCAVCGFGIVSYSTVSKCANRCMERCSHVCCDRWQVVQVECSAPPLGRDAEVGTRTSPVVDIGACRQIGCRTESSVCISPNDAKTLARARGCSQNDGG